MNVAIVTAGAAGMYCGSCLHDNTLAAAMIRRGHEVSLIPTYTPIRTDEEDVSIGRVFYGAINVYLEQKSALFRHTPRVLDGLLNRRGLLDWASRRSASVDPTDLGSLTLSVLEGEHGKQRKELDRLVEWLRDDLRPDIVQLTNSMFLGLARRIKQELGVPVLCAVQGEDLFLDGLVEPHAGRVRRALIERARDADGFISMSRYYVDLMVEMLEIPRERMHVVPLGVQVDGHGEGRPLGGDPPFTVGYLARICPEKGLHELLEAFRGLAEQRGKHNVRLRIAGYLGERDRPYQQGLEQEVRSWGLDGQVDWLGEVDRAGKLEFLRTLHVLSVPTTYREPKGLSVLEALASGVPVVQPAHGAFPEMLEATGGGVLVEPGSTPALTAALAALIDDPERRLALGRAGREAVHRDFNADRMAERTLNVYGRYVQNDG